MFGPPNDKGGSMHWQRAGGWWSGTVMAAAVACMALCGAFPATGQDVRYWDINGAIPGAGGSTPSGTWDSVTTNWSPAEAGDVATEAWQAGQFAVFSAGTDATGSFNVTLIGSNTASGVDVRQGTVNLVNSGTIPGTLVLGSGTVTVASGAKFTVNIASRLTQTTGGMILLDGGAVENTNPGSGGTFLPPQSIMATANGGTLVYSGTGVAIYRGNLLGQGGTTDAGTNTFTKTGQGEFRFDGTNTANSTFQKLVVKEGLFRLGSAAGTQETGFGALPEGPLADAITLDGGAIGSATSLQTDPFRGITLGPGGGMLNSGTTNSTLTLNGPISGGGLLRISGTGGFVLTSNDSSRTGGTVIGSEFSATGPLTASTPGSLTIFGDGALGAVPATPEPGNVRLGTATASGTLTISNNDTVIASTRGIDVGAGGGTLSSTRLVTYGGVLAGAGAFTKTGTGTFILSGSNTFAGGLRSVGGALVEVSSDANLGAVPVATATSAIVLADPSSSGRLRVTESFTMVPTRGITINVGGTTASPLGGTIDVAPLKTLTIGGPLTGPGRFTKSGSGTLVLAGTSSYAGTTTVSAGTLVVNGTITGSSAVSLAGGATLAGSGSIAGSVTLGSFTTLSPGNSPGTLSVGGTVTFGPGGNYNWQILNATGTAGSPGGWDLLSVGGPLVISATSGSPFAINLWSLASTGPDVSGSAANFNATQSYTWRIATAAGGITGFSADKFTISTSSTNGAGGFRNALEGGTFSLAQSGNDLNLVFTSAAPPVTTIDVPSGTQTQGGAGFPVLAGSTPFEKTGAGTLVLDAANPLTGPTTVTQGTLQLATADALSSSAVTVAAGATLSVGPQVAAVVPALVNNGLVDVGLGGLTVTSGQTAETIVAAIIAGRADGLWSGTSGITSSGAATQSERAVGWLDNGDGSYTVAFGAAGDWNLDGVVDFTDVIQFVSANLFNTGLPATWADGDFDYNGVVDFDDIIAAQSANLFNAGPYNTAPGGLSALGFGDGLAGGGIVAVPEPATWVLVALGAACAVGWRRRTL
jgi:fibronectin-binding autotransporter adhesin